MSFNRRQIGILLFVLFVIFAALIFYSHSFVSDGLVQGKTLSSKSVDSLIDKVNYTTWLLLLEFFIGTVATFMLINQKYNATNANEITISDLDIYHSEDLITEKKQVVKNDKNIELKMLTKDLETLCKKNLSYYDFCKNTLSIIGAHLPLVQGAFYNTTIINNEDYIELTAGYAFNKPEHGKIKFLLGEGLAGQAAKSKQTAKITDIPPSYLEVSSGLGSSNKVSLFEFPLLRKKELVGVIELAFFKNLGKAEVKEIEKNTSLIAKRIIELKKDIQN